MSDVPPDLRPSDVSSARGANVIAHGAFLPLLCGALLSLIASLFTPVIARPVNKCACNLTLPYPFSNIVTASSIDATITSIGAGDNWPSTWAGDDAIYTYFADGTGFGLPPAMSMAPRKLWVILLLVASQVRTSALRP